MDKKQFYRERLFISTGPLYKGRVMIEYDDETFRLATDDEIREAAQQLCSSTRTKAARCKHERWFQSDSRPSSQATKGAS